jgi:hypothetical protein
MLLNDASRVRSRYPGVIPVFTFFPLYYGMGIFGWLIFLALLGWINEE